MNKQRGSSSDMAEARIQWLAPNAARITRYAGSPPPDRAWLRHVLLPSDLTGLGDLSGLTAEVREGIVHMQTHDGATIVAKARAPRRSGDDHIHLSLRLASLTILSLG